MIVIGELRDRETVEIALTAAETGHLVLATMSTPSAAKTIDRLIDMFPPEEHSQVRASIAGALRAIVAQRLLPKRGGGVVPAIELVTGVLPLAVLIRDDKLYQLPNLMQRGRAFGMIRFDESLARARARRHASPRRPRSPSPRARRTSPRAAARAAAATPRRRGLFGRQEGRERCAIDALFDRLLERGGSDLHLSPGYPPMLRVRGQLVADGDARADERRTSRRC